jgi:hypothetical protein
MWGGVLYVLDMYIWTQMKSRWGERWCKTVFSPPNSVSPCVSVNNVVLDLDFWEEVFMNLIYHTPPYAPGRNDGQTVFFTS